MHCYHIHWLLLPRHSIRHEDTLFASCLAEMPMGGMTGTISYKSEGPILPAWHVDKCQAVEAGAVTPNLTQSEMWSFKKGRVIPCTASAVDSSLTKQAQRQLLKVCAVERYVHQSLRQVLNDPQHI